jgi:aspartyl-tRNA(Asn)/glutamyl-tRNA(Gln) amidotransferase subunit B
MTEFDLVIGLEVHVQLRTKSKMFCSCSAQYFGAEPNTHVCPVCLGLPGALPVANEDAIHKALLTGLALNCELPNSAKFDRKNYFYPDLAKGFQISQYDQPFAINGNLVVNGKKIRINRAHQEEDTGKLIHGMVDGKRVSLVDFNRSGVPLLEIVSEPDITSPEEAKDYAQQLNLLLKTIGVADVDMEKAGMRFDANLSLKRKGTEKLGTKVEIKNINSFRFLEKAIYYEFSRQAEILKVGGQIVQETRGWVESKGITQSQRTKEQAHDYRYFPEPDITTFTITNEYKYELEAQLPALPNQLIAKLAELGLDEQTAKTLVEKDFYDWYFSALDAYQQTESEGLEIDHYDSQKAIKVANWVIKDVFRLLKDKNLTVGGLKGEPGGLAELLYRIDQGKLTVANGRTVLEDYLMTGVSISDLISKGSYETASINLDDLAEKVIATNEKAVSDFVRGKEQAIYFLVGQVVREAKGGANPDEAKKVLMEKLNARRT